QHTISLSRSMSMVESILEEHNIDVSYMQALDSTVSEISRLRDQQLYPRLVQLVDRRI
ncbi:hypothetical protein S245_063239, partial [Arachis hypogaea]